jgi:hypothetical protein
MTVIKGDNGLEFNLYRHCDGYPAEAGAALLEAVARAHGVGQPSAAEVTRRLLGQPSEERGDYELADWRPEDQGDLEHVYVVEVREPAMVTHYARAGSSDADADDYRKWPHARHTLAAFAEVVNLDRRGINNRMKARGSSSEPYPMVSAQP